MKLAKEYFGEYLSDILFLCRKVAIKNKNSFNNDRYDRIY